MPHERREIYVARIQAFCCICESEVSVDTILTDGALRQALDGDDNISVMHVFVDEDGSSADHIWSLSSQEKENLRKYLG